MIVFANKLLQFTLILMVKHNAFLNLFEEKQRYLYWVYLTQAINNTVQNTYFNSCVRDTIHIAVRKKF